MCVDPEVKIIRSRLLDKLQSYGLVLTTYFLLRSSDIDPRPQTTELLNSILCPQNPKPAGSWKRHAASWLGVDPHNKGPSLTYRSRGKGRAGEVIVCTCGHPVMNKHVVITLADLIVSANCQSKKDVARHLHAKVTR